MQHITGLRLANWMRFRGEHELALEPRVYAVTARHVRDPARSNWLGKSALLAAIRYCLFGVYPVETIDGVISKGEKAAQVELELSDGTFVTRGRVRGGPSSFVATIPDGRGGEADARDGDVLARHLGLDDKNLVATSYFEQKEMARIVTATPGDRTTVLNEWLELEPLVRAHGRVSGSYQTLRAELEVAVRDRDGLKAQRVVLGERADLVAQVVTSQREFDDLKAQADSLAAVTRCFTAAERCTAAKQIAADLAAQLETPAMRAARGAVEPAEAAERDANAVLIAAAQECRNAEAAACGEFDGVCPVTGGACPVADEVQADAAGRTNVLTSCRLTEAEARRDLSRLRGVADLARQQARKRADLELRLKNAQDEVAKLAPHAKGAPAQAPVSPDVAGAARRQAEAEARVRELDTLEERLLRLDQRIEKLESEIAAVRVGSLVLGRSGAQRRVTERFALYLERRANERLAQADIDLTVGLEWGRATQQLADACDACGSPFPKSAKAKRCEVCGAPRGFKSDEKLHLRLSDRSGAAEDLAGIAMQLAAAEWLRRVRGARWSVAVLDEPFGALDQANRQALAHALDAMVRDGGFDQGFVVAHDPGLLDVFSRRILIEADDRWSKVRVG